MRKVFISHSKRDSWVANKIAEEIEQAGCRTFLDEQEIQFGDDFLAKVAQELPNCQEMLVLFTPWALDRTWIWMEIGMAKSNPNFRIVPILHGLTVDDFMRMPQPAGVFHRSNVLELNEFPTYISELCARIES